MTAFQQWNYNEKDNHGDDNDGDGPEDDDLEMQRILWDSRISNNIQPRKSALEIIQHVLQTLPNALHQSQTSVSAGVVSKPIRYTNQMIHHQGIRSTRQNGEWTKFAFPVENMDPQQGLFGLSYSPTPVDPVIPNFLTVDKTPVIVSLSHRSGRARESKERDKEKEQCMMVTWCDPYAPGGNWLRQDACMDNDELALFTCSSIFSQCLPNELAYALPLVGALWIPNVKLVRAQEHLPLSIDETKTHSNEFVSCLLPWNNHNRSDDGSIATQSLTDQFLLILELAFIYDIHHIYLSLDRWAHAGCAPVEIAQRIVQSLNRFCAEHPKNILFVQQRLRVHMSIRAESFSVWSMSFQSVLNSDSRQKVEAKESRQTTDVKEGKANEAKELKYRDAREAVRDGQQNNAMSAASRLLAIERTRERIRRARERQLYVLCNIRRAESDVNRSNPNSNSNSNRDNARRERQNRETVNNRANYLRSTYSSQQKAKRKH